MSVAYIQPIFAPDERIFNKNLRSIESMKQYLDKYNYNIKLAFGGWGVDPYIDRIISCINELFPDAICEKFERNFGKAYIINNLYDKHIKQSKDIDYLLLSDSDIVYDISVPFFIERLIAAGKSFSKWQGKEFGLIAPNQIEGNCHILEKILVNRYDFMENERCECVCHPEEPSGIAGGCWLTSRHAWDAIGGYRTMGVYAGEDAYYLLDLGNNGFSYGMMDSIHVIHPPDTDPDYNQWKYNTCIRDTTGHAIMDLDEKIKDADEFWRNKNR